MKGFVLKFIFLFSVHFKDHFSFPFPIFISFCFATLTQTTDFDFGFLPVPPYFFFIFHFSFSGIARILVFKMLFPCSFLVRISWPTFFKNQRFLPVSSNPLTYLRNSLWPWSVRNYNLAVLFGGGFC